ncbi:MAG: hypothetical protein LRY39_00560 [Alphaproteobacteria bacterium]|nr:hypothetical protein [Alphaproteobacteria bacterium]
MIVYDDSTAGSVNADLGGGTLGSPGLNILSGNTLEDLTIDLDGGTLAAQNNWWGQASGEYQSAPSGGLKPQIYYGAPIDDGLVGHWTFDSEWLDATTAYDRSGNNNNGIMQGGLSAAAAVSENKRQALVFDGNDRVDIPNLIGGTVFTIVADFNYTAPGTWQWIYGTGPAGVNTGGSVKAGSNHIRYHDAIFNGDGVTILTPGQYQTGLSI